ncbi:muramoyltetrapeptide carboxypeptidase [Draconibacterium orientale]|uniref:Muramoyltetrapeptide carboxypeptidase n=1 Tax=Draconibacterium orientale TaxID=1168034 RepID=X5E007_9BACT|nr:LD-carboxypeptidase [Draconibacterium orientale]AHW59896.1 peptidase S66 [Draconibacterium orientale]SET75136.1 muramoyltetrapeptide carboxypeptidase [Draconibacterium orientale]
MIALQPIKPGSTIRIVSPAGKIDKKYVMPAVNWLEEQGYTVKLGEHVFARHFQFAGTDEQRAADVQEALDDSDCDAIICSRGGYGTVRIIQRLDFTQFLKKPKWLVGFSDITILHSRLHNLNVPTIHGVMPRYFLDGKGAPREDLMSMMKLIKGEGISYEVDATEFDRRGAATGQLLGGNLSIVNSLHGTKYDIDTAGKILFLEDIDEFLYHTDRMVHQLKLSGKLDNLAGLILGDFTDMKDNESPFGQTVHEIFAEAVKDRDYPVCYGFPGGHDKKNLALAFGREWQLDVAESGTRLRLKGD